MLHKSSIRRLASQKDIPNTTQMSQIIFGGLLSTPAPTAPIVGIASIVLFAIVGIMVGPNYDGMNAPEVGNSKNNGKS